MSPQDTLHLAQKRLESLEATAELLRIPGFEEAFERAREEVAEGWVTPLENLELDD